MKQNRELRDLVSVGPATLADFQKLGVRSVAQLARCEADELYERLCKVTGRRQDPCVHDVFSAAIAQARDPGLGPEQCRWNYWTRVRKAAARGR